MSSEWPVLPLEDCLDALIDYRGKTPEKTTSGVPLVTAKIIKGGRIERPSEFIADAAYDAWMRRGIPQAGDVVLTTEAPMGEVAQLGRDRVALAQRVVTLRGKAGLLDSTFLLYLLQTDDMQEQLRARATGTTVLGIKQSELRKIVVPLPPIGLQRSSASVLAAVDKRIDLLRETNATLEAIAQALFKSWFVDFDPVRAKQQGLAPAGMDEATAALFPDSFEESALGLVPIGWRVGTLGDVSLNPRLGAKPEKIPPETPYFGLEHMPRRSIALASAGTAEGLESGKFWFERDDVLFGKLRPYFHKVGLAPTRGVCSTDILVVRPNVPSLLGFVAMHASSDALIAHTTMLSNGARMPRTSWQDIAGFKVVLPPEEVAAAFNGVAYALFERIYANIGAARALSEARDTLLPRLISGKLRLPEAEAEAEVEARVG